MFERQGVLNIAQSGVDGSVPICAFQTRAGFRIIRA
jgi:hypothetical protein